MPARRLLLTGLLALCAGPVLAHKQPLTDEELGEVAGQGIVVAVDLVMTNAQFTAGFNVGGTTTYAIAQGVGGTLDLFAIGIDPLVSASGQSYISITLPGLLAASQFGVQALGVGTDPNVPIANSMGSLFLNGTASMTGQLNIWAK